MLYFESIDPGTLSILNRLMALPSLNSFSLVGGSALALRYGHRISENIDLFYHENFDFLALEYDLREEFGPDFVYESGHKQLGIFSSINAIKVDIVYYPREPIGPIEFVDGIRMYSSEDIAARKIQNILGRSRQKDFWDLNELLRHFTLQQIIDFHNQKFPSQMLAISIPNALSYFVDADESEEPISLKGQTWDGIKKEIRKVVREYLA